MGPNFLQLSESEWPKKSANDVAVQARDNVIKIQKKTFVAALTRSQLKEQNPVRVQNKVIIPRRPPAAAIIQQLVNIRRLSSLRKLIGIIAWFWRAAKKFLHVKVTDKEKWEAVPSSGVITVDEREDVFRDLCLATQEGVQFPTTTTDRLVVYKDGTSGLLMCGGRVQTFKEDRSAVPLLPFQAWISTLLARAAHGEGHDGVAGTLLRMQKKAWVIRGRIIARKVVNKCIMCKKERAKTCQQIMGNLPEERSSPSAPFQFISICLAHTK